MTTRTTLKALAFIVQLVGIVVSGYLMARVPDPPRAHDVIPGGVALGTILRQPSDAVHRRAGRC